jgi:hypothetical protein
VFLLATYRDDGECGVRNGDEFVRICRTSDECRIGNYWLSEKRLGNARVLLAICVIILCKGEIVAIGRSFTRNQTAGKM